MNKIAAIDFALQSAGLKNQANPGSSRLWREMLACVHGLSEERRVRTILALSARPALPSDVLKRVGTQEASISGLARLARTYPCQRFAYGLTAADA